MSNDHHNDEGQIDRRQFLKLMGMGAVSATALSTNIAKALAIPANNLTGTIQDVEHIIILMQENRPFDHHFGALRGVRGFNDPRAVNINLPLQGGGSTLASVFLQPAGAANVAAGYGVAPNSGTLGGPANGVEVIPPFHVNPESISSGLTSLGFTYFPGTNHSWENTHGGWDLGQWDMWPTVNGPMTMSYMTREDIPYHYALADAFTVCDSYHLSIMGPTNPNRMYMWTGCVGNVNYLGSGGTDGQGAGPATANGPSPNNALWVWQTFPEVLQRAGITWKVYQDIFESPYAPNFGYDPSNAFAGNYGDNTLLYFNQYATAAPGTPLFDNAATGTNLADTMPSSSAPQSSWLAWAESQFSQFRSDVRNGNLPQVSWIVAPAGYCEHPDWPVNYGAWYISQVMAILVNNPEVFRKTVFIINYDEADGSFDHIVPPTVPSTPAYGASTVSIENEIVTTSTPNGPIGLGPRVPFIAISPWSKGGWVCSQVFDHTSVIQFIEQRFGVHEKNISPWRRAVAGDLTSVFNFATPNAAFTKLPSTAADLPPVDELAGGSVTTFVPTLGDVTVGVPRQEKGIRPARALPYVLNVEASVDVSNNTIELTFINTGAAAVVFQVRSANPADVVRFYTVEPRKTLSGTWNIVSSFYNLSVYGPNGFVRYFVGSTGPSSAALTVTSSYEGKNGGGLNWTVANLGSSEVGVAVFNAYTGTEMNQSLAAGEAFGRLLSLSQFYGWYDIIITVAEDPSFSYRLAGHVETGNPSWSDPALGGLVTLKG
jgi:phospholipase C